MMENRLFAGAGSAPICFPPEIFPLEGFCAVHDDPMARILLLECGQRAVIVCLELVMLSPDGIEAVKKAVAEITATEPEHIWVHTTHAITTPHAPHAPMGMGGVELEIGEEEKKELENKLELFNRAVMNGVTAAARQARDSFRPARMGVGTGVCGVNVNRDVATEHGWWINFNPDGPSNHTAAILRVEDDAGALIAVFVSYGLKPCAIDNSEMENNTRLISSDVPGLACRIWEETLGAPCMFAMSAAGDQVPLEQAWYDVVEADGTVRKVDLGVQAGLEMTDRLGRRMAAELDEAIRTVTCDQTNPEIRFGKGGITWPGKDRGRMEPTRQADYVEKGRQTVDVLTMLIGDVALVGLKPEINTRTEEQLQAASPYQQTLILSMVNGGQKYMPDMVSYERSTWEAQSAPFMPGVAEAWVDETVNVLNRMREVF